MYLDQLTKLTDNMKNGFRRSVLCTMIAGCFLPVSAYAFVDERTPAPPAPPEIVAPTLLVPAATPPEAPAVIPGVTETASPVFTSPVAEALQSGVRGDLSAPAWQAAYPGPYGQMPLADALIAQVVPVVGTAIELNGDPALLNTSVVVGQGASRQSTLESLASNHGLTIFLQGTRVTVASGKTPSQGEILAQAGPATPEPVAPPPEPTKVWHIPKGSMLSTAILEWANEWGWELIWRADVDYRIAADIRLDATFLDGVGKVLEAYRAGNRPLWGDWNDEQKVLVIREPNSRDK